MAPRQKRKSRKQRNRQRFQSIFEDSHPVENNQLWSPKIRQRQSSPLIEKKKFKLRQPTAKVIVRDLKSDTPRKYVVSSSSEDDEDTDTDTDSENDIISSDKNKEKQGEKKAGTVNTNCQLN